MRCKSPNRQPMARQGSGLPTGYNGVGRRTTSESSSPSAASGKAQKSTFSDRYVMAEELGRGAYGQARLSSPFLSDGKESACMRQRMHALLQQAYAFLAHPVLHQSAQYSLHAFQASAVIYPLEVVIDPFSVHCPLARTSICCPAMPSALTCCMPQQQGTKTQSCP